MMGNGNGNAVLEWEWVGMEMGMILWKWDCGKGMGTRKSFPVPPGQEIFCSRSFAEKAPSNVRQEEAPEMRALSYARLQFKSRDNLKMRVTPIDPQ